mgnify:CR=1 FL=1
MQNATTTRQQPFTRKETVEPKPTHQLINRAARRKADHDGTPIANGEFWTLMKPYVKPLA